MAYVAPTVRSVGDAVTAADYNIMANDVIALAVPPGAKAVRTSTYAANNTDLTYESIASPGFDNDSMWSAGSPTRLTVNTAGIYIVTSQTRAVISGGTPTVFTIAIQKNGSQVGGANFFMSVGAGNNFDATVVGIFRAVATDYFTVKYSQSGFTATHASGELTSLSAVMIGRI